jgi:hypothetical protein
MKKLFIVLVIINILLFLSSFSAYFFQDDFFNFQISHATTISSVLHFFIPHTDIQFYRPLSSEIFFFTGRYFFEFVPMYYHLVVWFVLVFNWFLVYKITQKFIPYRVYSSLVVVLYATSAIHYNTLFWLSNFSYVFGATWFFLAFLMISSEGKLTKKRPLLVIIYLLGLLTSEFVIVFPFIMIAWFLLMKQQQLKEFIISFIPLIIITGCYIYMRTVVFPPDLRSYHIELNRQIISSYRFFLMYFLNWPETMKDNMLSYIKIRPIFLSTFLFENIIWLFMSIWAICIVVIPISFLTSKKFSIYWRLIVFLSIWILVSVGPIVIVPSHIAPHHGSIALVGFLILLMYPMSLYRQKVWMLYPLLTVWLVSSALTISFDNQHHWILRRANIAHYWIDRLPKKDIIIVPSDEKEVKVALDDGEAFRQIYNDDNIKVKFLN